VYRRLIPFRQNSQNEQNGINIGGQKLGAGWIIFAGSLPKIAQRFYVASLTECIATLHRFKLP